jgi:hypothetical protein
MFLPTGASWYSAVRKSKETSGYSQRRKGPTDPSSKEVGTMSVSIVEVKNKLDAVYASLHDLIELLESLEGDTVLHVDQIIICPPIFIPPTFTHRCGEPIAARPMPIKVEHFRDSLGKMETWLKDIRSFVGEIDPNTDLPGPPIQP